MTVEQIKAKINPKLRVQRVHASLYPEVRDMAMKLGDGNISKGITRAVVAMYELHEGER
jgi:hypothetical protein